MFSKYRARMKCSTRLNRTVVERLNANSVQKTFNQIIYVDTLGSRRWSLACARLSGPLSKKEYGKEKRETFIVEKPEEYLLNQVIKVNIISDVCGCHVPPEMMWWQGHFTSVVFFPKTHNLSLIDLLYMVDIVSFLGQLWLRYFFKVPRWVPIACRIQFQIFGRAYKSLYEGALSHQLHLMATIWPFCPESYAPSFYY